MLTVVLVSFPKHGWYVLNIKDVKNFNPKAANDFEKEKLCKVRWEDEKTKDSESPAAVRYYDANILLVAACEKSLMEQAKKHNIRLPRGFKEKLGNKSAAPIEDSVEMAHKASKRTKKQVKLAMTKSCKDRMVEILRANDAGNVISSSSSDNDNTQARNAPSTSASESQPQTVATIEDKADTEVDSSALEVNLKHASEDTEMATIDSNLADKEHSNGAASIEMEENKQKSHTVQKCKRKISFDDNHLQVDGAENGAAELVGRTSGLETTTSLDNPLKVSSGSRAKRRYDGDKSDSDDGSLISYVSSTSLLARAQEEVIKKQRLLTLEKKHNSILRTQCSSQELKLSLLKSKLKEMVEIFEDGQPSFANDLSDVNGSVLVDSFGKLIEAKSKVKISNKSPKKTPKKSPKKSPIKRSVKRSPKKSPKKTTSKSPKKKSKKESSANCDYQNHAVIGTMIFNDLEGTALLQKDGQGQVHLGNGVWIRESLWSKLKKSKRSLSIVVQDLAEGIWGFKRCAEFSLTGGTSPKNPGAKPKDQAPPDVVHAILGFYRAKIMQQGITVTAVLDNNVEKIGRSILRSKFQNAAKKWSRQQKQAEKFAEEELEKTGEEHKEDDEEDDDDQAED